MDELMHIVEARGGYLTRGQLNDLGYSDPIIRSMVRDRVLRRLRHGTYTSSASWLSWSDSERHGVLVRSVLDKLGPGVAASHHSAAAIHGFDLYGADLDEVHIVRLDGRPGRREAGVIHHHGATADDDLAEIDGLLAVKPSRAVFDTCTVSTVESGMVVASSAMNLEKVSRDQLVTEGFEHAHWLGGRTARLAIRLADERLESVGETRSLHMMWRHHVPRPDMQIELHDHLGHIVARTDFTWIDARHVGEFDGMIKYGRLNPFSEDPGQVLVHEKAREDSVRELGFGMSRWVWRDLDSNHQQDTAARLRHGIERSRGLYLRNATHIV